VRSYREWASRQRPSARGGEEQTFDFEDVFRGGGGGDAGGGFSDLFGDLIGRARRGRGPLKGPDLESEITIDFVSSLRGATLELHPQGLAADALVTVRIPPGASEGSRVRIAGQGGTSPNGGPRGDLVLTVHVTAHPHFRREGADLHLDLPITIAEAYHGAKVKVPTVDGSVTMKVPERTQSGSVVRLRGKGVTKKGRQAGDLYVHFLVQIPKDGAGEVAELVDRIARFQTEDPRSGIRL